jgi:hypothetical protein
MGNEFMGNEKENNQKLVGVQPGLQTEVWEANKTEKEGPSVCLLVHGLIVCGTIIGVRECRKLMNAGSSPSQQEIEETPPSIISLKDTRIFIPGGTELPSNEGVTWMGNICSVDGFWIGQMRSVTD